MKAEKPAVGIMKTNEWGDSIHYHIRCDCGNDDCSHDVEIEADEYFDIQVTIYVRSPTKWGEKNRWKQIWNILTKGYTEMESTIVLKEQTALNYASTLKTAITDMKKLKETK